MANASGMATGHYLGDSGVLSNTIFTGYPVPAASGSMTPFIENDPVLGDIDAHFSGNFVDEDTILLTARHQGFRPSFKSRFVSEAPMSNADIGKTMAHILGLNIPFNGALRGRVVEEVLPSCVNPTVENFVERSTSGAEDLATLVGQHIGPHRYFDAAGFPGRTVGMDERKAASR